MQVLAEGPLLWKLLEAVHTAGYAKPTQIQMQAHMKKLPLLDDTTAQDGPCAIILALRPELVTQTEEVLRRGNHIVLDEGGQEDGQRLRELRHSDLADHPEHQNEGQQRRRLHAHPAAKGLRRVQEARHRSQRRRGQGSLDGEDAGAMNTRNQSFLQEDFQFFIPGGQVSNPMQV